MRALTLVYIAVEDRPRYVLAMQENQSADTHPASGLRMGGTEWALLVTQSMLWGSAFFFAELVVKELPPLTIAAFRLMPAAFIVVAVCFALGSRLPVTFTEWRRFIPFAAFNSAVPFFLVLWAQREVTGGVAALFNASAPVFGVFLAHALTHDEKITAGRLAGIFMGLLGIGVLVGEDLVSGSSSALLPKLALLAAALCYALSSVGARVYLRNYTPYTIAAGQLTGALALTLPIALLVDQPWTLPVPSWTAVGAIAWLGIFSSALAALCYFNILHRAGATSALLVTLLLPLTPIVLGAVFLGEMLTVREMIGGLIICAALVLIDGRLFRRWLRGLRKGKLPA
jgi:drug/metabolite transporter (DMT)-like permease